MKTLKQHPFILVLAIYILLVVCISTFAALTNTYDTSTPGGSDDPREADDRMRETKAAVQERMNDHNGTADEGDHYWPLTGTEVSDSDAGQHRMVTLRQLSDNPSTLTSYSTTTDLGFLYQKDISSNGELFWEDEADNVIQLTSGGGLYSSTTFTTVGNATIGGTLDVTGNIDPTSYEDTNGGFLDEDAMGTNSDTAVASQQSIKAYADNKDVDGTPTAVFTKYFTGNLTTVSKSVAHGLSIDNILSVSVVAYNSLSSSYYVSEIHNNASANNTLMVFYDTSNIDIFHGLNFDNQKYRIRIDYK